MDYRILLDLALILLGTKLLGLLFRRIGLPQVVGALVAGLLLGPAVWEPLTGGKFIPVSGSATLDVLSELGVILIMFSAGLETDLKELKKNGLKAGLIALMGVAVPLGLGFLVAMPFFGVNSYDSILSCVFVGVIITATSVSITVETLKELGKLNGAVGTTILSAAIIDDVIGIVILSVVTGFKNPSGEAGIWKVLVGTVLFFVAAIAVGIGLKYLFRLLEKRWPHKRRVPIFGLVLCLVYAYCAESLFGIADITGAYVAGIVLSGTKETDYIDSKIGVSSYMLFSPIFFADIGIETSFDGFSADILWFALLFVAAGIVGKIIGCGVTARLCGFSGKDSARIGIGMIARGEVALVVTQRGLAEGIIGSQYLTATVLLVIVTSFLTPILLKLLFRSKGGPESAGGAPGEPDGVPDSAAPGRDADPDAPTDVPDGTASVAAAPACGKSTPPLFSGKTV